jgi:hypothetical protein
MIKIPNQPLNKWWERITNLADIQTTDPVIERKGQMLALYIMLIFGILVYVVINNLYVMVVYNPPEYTLYLIQDIIAFIPLYLFWKLNKKGYVTFTAYVIVLFSILAIVFGSDPKFIEYLMIVFCLPVGISSFVIKPSSSLFFALLTAVAYTISSLLAGYIWEYNFTAIIALFSLAIMTWSIAHQLERAFQKNDALVRTLRKSNRDINDAYETTLEGWSHALEVRDHETEGTPNASPN